MYVWIYTYIYIYTYTIIMKEAGISPSTRRPAFEPRGSDPRTPACPSLNSNSNNNIVLVIVTVIVNVPFGCVESRQAGPPFPDRTFVWEN